MSPITESTRKVAVCAAIIILAAAISGCATKPVSIRSNPPEANLRINQANVGTTPATYEFDFGRVPSYVISASKAGYVDEQLMVTKDHPMIRSGAILLNLTEDEGYRMTVESEATNRWLRIQINPELAPESTWQRLVDSITTTYDSLEQMDQTAGYIRTSPKVRMFSRGAQGSYIIRSYLVASIATADPLTYRFQVRSQTRPVNASDHFLEDYGRIFREDAQLIQELQMRLGLR